jgi:hypothetical protein
MFLSFKGIILILSNVPFLQGYYIYPLQCSFPSRVLYWSYLGFNGILPQGRKHSKEIEILQCSLFLQWHCIGPLQCSFPTMVLYLSSPILFSYNSIVFWYMDIVIVFLWKEYILYKLNPNNNNHVLLTIHSHIVKWWILAIQFTLTLLILYFFHN